MVYIIYIYSQQQWLDWVQSPGLGAKKSERNQNMEPWNPANCCWVAKPDFFLQTLSTGLQFPLLDDGKMFKTHNIYMEMEDGERETERMKKDTYIIMLFKYKGETPFPLDFPLNQSSDTRPFLEKPPARSFIFFFWLGSGGWCTSWIFGNDGKSHVCVSPMGQPPGTAALALPWWLSSRQGGCSSPGSLFPLHSSIPSVWGMI